MSEVRKLDNTRMSQTFHDLMELQDVKQQIKTLEEKKRLLEGNLKESYFTNLDAHEKVLFVYHGRAIASCKLEIKTGLDTKKLKEELPELWIEYPKQSVSSPIRFI